MTVSQLLRFWWLWQLGGALGRVFCRMSLIWDSTSVFLMIRLGGVLLFLSRRYQQVTVVTVVATTETYDLDHLAQEVCAPFFYCEVNFSPFPPPSALRKQVPKWSQPPTGLQRFLLCIWYVDRSLRDTKPCAKTVPLSGSKQDLTSWQTRTFSEVLCTLTRLQDFHFVI